MDEANAAIAREQAEAQEAQEALEAMKDEANRKLSEMMANGAEGLRDAFDAELREKKALQQELDDLKAEWSMMSSRNAMLEAALIMQPQQQDTGQRPPVGNAGLSPQEINTHMKELDRQLCLDHDKKKE